MMTADSWQYRFKHKNSIKEHRWPLSSEVQSAKARAASESLIEGLSDFSAPLTDIDR
jgi:hypothetical protein